MKRRKFLRALGWTAGGLTVLGVGAHSVVPPLPTFGKSKLDEAVGWVSAKADGSVHFLLPRAEMGQGIDTGLAQIVAEELRIDVASVQCAYQRTDRMAPCQMTVGSQSIENYARLTAVAAATLRQTLVTRAKARWPDASATLTVADGHVIDGGSNRMAYANLLQADEDTIVIVKADASLPLFSAADAASRQTVGHSVQAQHLHEIVTGAERYSRDVSLPDMVFGAVLAPPRLGATLDAVNRTAAARVPGFVSLVDGPGGQIGAVAQTPHALSEVVARLEPTWREPEPDFASASAIDIDKLIAQDALDHSPIDTGDVALAMTAAATRASMRYDSPMAAHAAMEPRAGVARWDPASERLEVWTGSQDPWLVRTAVAEATGVARDSVSVYNHRIGGAFGGRSLCQASVQAAWLARTTGFPVKVQWSREEEFRHNYVGPAFSTRIDAGLDTAGRISYWHHQMAGAPVLTSSTFFPPYLHWLADLPPDPGTARGTQLPYAVDNHKVDFADVRVPMPTGPWRGLGAAGNTFAVESAMDELALAAGTDPIAFRLQHAKDVRFAGVLERLRERLASSDVQQVGIAACAYKEVTYVALAAELHMDAQVPRVHRMWCVHDCGDVIAPDRVRAQIEGNLAWGISMALHEAYVLEDGLAVTDNFHNYPVARMRDMPELDIELVDLGAPASGAGEAAIAPVAAAIANAVFRVTGKRHRALPITHA